MSSSSPCADDDRGFEVTTHPFATSGGVVLNGDLYRPRHSSAAPVVVSIHGGGWCEGSRTTHQEWGRFLAGNGIALFAADRRHFPEETPAFPGVTDDFNAALAFVAKQETVLKVDSSRMAVMGDSSGGFIAALVGLGGAVNMAEDISSSKPRQQILPKAIIGIYGVYDLAAEWIFEQVARPFDRCTEKLFQTPLVDDRLLYARVSPISYATRSRNAPRVLLAWGTDDAVVDENLHSKAFARALAQANFIVTEVQIPHAQHFWFCDPLDEPSSYSAFLAPRLLRFLKTSL